MDKKRIVFVGKQNSANSEMAETLTQRFEVVFSVAGDRKIDDLLKSKSFSAVVVSLIGEKAGYVHLFEMLKQEENAIPVITVGTEYESMAYRQFYMLEHFHKLLRPMSDEELLNECCALVYEDDEFGMGKGAKASGPAHILVVDDNAMVLRNVKAMLDGTYSVAVAASASQAFVSIGKKHPDLILLDYEMPLMDGKATMEMLQNNEETKDIPVIFLTSVATKEIVTQLLLLKPAGYILKPAERAALLTLIEKTLGK